jgi:hypothetical protein
MYKVFFEYCVFFHGLVFLAWYGSEWVIELWIRRLEGDKNAESIGIWKGAVVAYFNILSENFLWGTEKTTFCRLNCPWTEKRSLDLRNIIFHCYSSNNNIVFPAIKKISIKLGSVLSENERILYSILMLDTPCYLKYYNLYSLFPKMKVLNLKSSHLWR